MSNAVNSPSSSPAAAPIDAFSVRPLPSAGSLTASAAAWIELSGSMTRAIGETLAELPRVIPGHEGPTLLAPWERRMLGLEQRRGYAREVVLSVRGVPVLSARTVSRLDDPALEVIRRLGDRPLAQLLFEDSRWIRGSAPIPLIEGAQRRIGRVCQWYCLGRPGQGRRRSRILVSEFFEPDGVLNHRPPDSIRR